jgi:hypothetical protein
MLPRRLSNLPSVVNGSAAPTPGIARACVRGSRGRRSWPDVHQVRAVVRRDLRVEGLQGQGRAARRDHRLPQKIVRQRPPGRGLRHGRAHPAPERGLPGRGARPRPRDGGHRAGEAPGRPDPPRRHGRLRPRAAVRRRRVALQLDRLREDARAPGPGRAQHGAPRGAAGGRPGRRALLHPPGVEAADEGAGGERRRRPGDHDRADGRLGPRGRRRQVHVPLLRALKPGHEPWHLLSASVPRAAARANRPK